jgi:glycosyltransferase involved in cell wall biosynthesis
MPAPLVSVITPSYNQAPFLEQTIQSVLAQDYQPLELIVMDGASTDGSQDILRRYQGRLAYWESQPDRGQAHAINKGLQRARGEFIGWLNSDDLLLPGTVSKVVSTFDLHPDIDVVYGRLERIDADGRLLPTPLLPKDKLVFSRELVIGECLVNQPGSFWRRRTMEQVGLLDEKLSYAMDYEYWVRIALAGGRFFRLPDAVAQFRLSSTSKTVAHTAHMAMEQLQVLEQLIMVPELSERLELSDEELKRQARRARATISLHVAYGQWKLGDAAGARRWLGKALRAHPGVLLQRRWLDLGLARLARRRVKYNHG